MRFQARPLRHTVPQQREIMLMGTRLLVEKLQRHG